MKIETEPKFLLALERWRSLVERAVDLVQSRPRTDGLAGAL